MPHHLHHHTPSLSACDPRGLEVRCVAYHRRSTAQPPEARISRQSYTASGFLCEQWDARLGALHDKDPSIQPNQLTVFSLSGSVLCCRNVDQGPRIVWVGSSHQVLDRWDGAGTRHRYEYDALVRLTAVFEQPANAPQPRCTERLSYAQATAEKEAGNGCGRLRRHDDPAGTLLYEHYDLWGNTTAQSRRFCRDLAGEVDWPLSPALRDLTLEDHTYATQWQYGALGQLMVQTDAKGYRQEPRYGVDGLLASLAVTLNRGVRRTVLQQRHYSASGNVEREYAGNGMRSVLAYDVATDQLLRCTTYRNGQLDLALQDLSYTYDPIGQVLSIRDAAQQTQWLDNTQIESSCTYSYDTLYQLITATGRENAHQGHGPGLPGRVDFGASIAQRCRHYRQNYTYDAGGNLVSLRHVPTQGSGYTRRMSVSNTSNHSLAQDADFSSSPRSGRGFDLNGNQQFLQQGQALHWTLRDQLQRVTQVVREDGANDDEVYRYDASGQRILKARVYNAHRKVHLCEIRYLPGLEIRRNSATGEWLNVVTVEGDLGSVRVLLWEQGMPSGMQEGQMRYSLSTHLGSRTLELDQDARLLSQEDYYPYGGTSWLASKNAIEATYKTLRFSGKERDASGLYYFGYRYYAPWLFRWISADPAGDVDGLNLYCMANGNPVSRSDAQGLQSNDVAAPKSRTVSLRSFTAQVSSVVRSRVQIASSAAIRDALSTYISNALSTGLDVALFEGVQPTAALNNALRSTVALLDALAMLHMTSGLLGNVVRWSPFIGFAVAASSDLGFEHRADVEAGDTALVWDPVARQRLGGHLRAFSREIMQQALRGLGDSASWGQTPVGARVPRTLLASAAYGLATVPNAIFSGAIPAPLIPNIGPLIEAYDAAAGSIIRSGHASVRLERHQQTLQLPPAIDTLHGGLSRMFNQTWTYWAGVGIEAVAAYATGSPPDAQSARTRTWVGVARGIVSAITEVRGILLQTARAGFGNISRLWRPTRA